MSESGPRRPDPSELEREAEEGGEGDPLLTRVGAIARTADVERLDAVPEVAFHDEEPLRPVEVIRVGRRYFARMRGHRDAWWMGEFDDSGTLRVWGVYGTTLEEAVRHH